MIKKLKTAVKKMRSTKAVRKVNGAVLEENKPLVEAKSEIGKTYTAKDLIDKLPGFYRVTKEVKSAVVYTAFPHMKEFFILSVTSLLQGSYKSEDVSITVAYKNSGEYVISTTIAGESSEFFSIENDKELKSFLETHTYAIGERTYMVGSDPEIFVENKEGTVLPAFEFLKEKPKPEITRERTDLPAYWDGFQAEFETHPETCLAYHVDYIQYGLTKVLHLARLKDKDAKLSLKTVMDISPKLLKSAKDEHVEFGCMPSLNAYGMQGLIASGRETTFRPAGGHIHFGVGKVNQERATKAIKSLDAILGVCCVSMFAQFDDPRRRTLYGLAGEFRLPKHGIEYRTLSNAWLSHPLITHMVFDLARRAFNLGFYNLFDLTGWDCPEEETIRIINQCDVKAARKIMEKNKSILMKIFQRQYQDKEKAFAAYNGFYGGIESLIVEPEDLCKNWVLDGAWTNHTGIANKYFNSAFAQLKFGKKVA